MHETKSLHLVMAAITMVAAPAVAQDLTAILRVQGEVMVSAGGDFRTAIDGQPIMPGQRLMVGEGASATVQVSQDCKRTYGEAGVYTITPVLCDEDERQRRADRSAEAAGELSGATSNPLASVGILLGTVVGLPLVVDQIDDDPTSR